MAAAAVDLMIVPASAVDHSGVRMGWGLGYFDRALAALSPAPPVFAVVHDDEILPHIPADPRRCPHHRGRDSVRDPQAPPSVQAKLDTCAFTHAYRCADCGHAFDIYQSFSDDALTACPECDGTLRKVFGSLGVTFNGSGFYRNDSSCRRLGWQRLVEPGFERLGIW